VAAVAAGAKAAAQAAAPVNVVATRMVFAIADFLPGFMIGDAPSELMLLPGPILPQAGIAGASPLHHGKYGITGNNTDGSGGGAGPGQGVRKPDLGVTAYSGLVTDNAVHGTRYNEHTCSVSGRRIGAC
jgi:hypothetical protein